MSSFTLDLHRARRAACPRYAPPSTPLRAVLIHGGIMLLWVLLFLRAFGAGGPFALSIGLAYIGYDTALQLFVFVQTLPLRHPLRPCSTITASTRVVEQGLSLCLSGQLHRRADALGADAALKQVASIGAGHKFLNLGVIVAAYNEAAVLPASLTALFAQTTPPDEVVIADDGSDDATADLLTGTYGLVRPAPGDMSAASSHHPTLRWLRLPRGGKARALNEALGRIQSEVVVTVDADTVLDREAMAAMRSAFAVEPALVAATGILFPVCPPTWAGRMFQWFQTYEYMRNFLSRYAWARQDGLLLISGAFAAYRRRAVLAVGGFEPDCLVEDYELTHRLLHYAAAHGLRWRTDVIGGAKARTEAPSSLGGFLRQRRRWFGGFLQTQLWYRHMVGNRRYGRLGTRMLPAKAFDTMQPLYGLASIGLLIGYGLAGSNTVVGPAASVIGGKIGIDLLFHFWSLMLYRRWVGQGSPTSLGSMVLAALVEPFTFQVLRHSGAALGWMSFLTRERRWGDRNASV